MTSVVVADAGPLIGLARIRRLDILHALYGSILVPAQVLGELRIDEQRHGSQELFDALESDWIDSVDVEIDTAEPLARLLDPGETAAILLAEQHRARFLLIDEVRGRHIAHSRNIPVVGTGGVLIAAKRSGLIDRVAPILEQLGDQGYWLSKGLRQRLLELAGESEL